jgi:hypothetical protein
LTVRDCVIRNFGQDGIDFFPDGGGILSVSNTVVSDNGNSGIAYYPSGVISSVVFGSVILNRVEISNNAQYGFFLWGAQSVPSDPMTAALVAKVIESTVSGGQYGLYALSGDGHPTAVINLFHSVVTGAQVGLRGESLGFITVANSMVSGNVKDWQALTTGNVESFGDSYFQDNAQPNGQPGTAPGAR